MSRHRRQNSAQKFWQRSSLFFGKIDRQTVELVGHFFEAGNHFSEICRPNFAVDGRHNNVLKVGQVVEDVAITRKVVFEKPGQVFNDVLS